jgi:diguanylate cyclase (GGDEF)-like protein
MALILALAAVLEAIEPEPAVEGCVALAALVAVFWFAGPARFGWQLGAALVVLAYLTLRTHASPLMPALYLLVAFYGALRLEPAPLYWLAAFAAVTHGVMLFMLIDRGEAGDLARAWTQFGAIALGMGWIAFCAGAVARLRRRLAETARALHDLQAQANDRASRDPLTGAYHRNHLMEALEREVARANRVGKPLSVARIDVDHFRDLNESLGHSLGDAVLRGLVSAAHDFKRDSDVFGRYGANEFLVIMPDTDLAGALIAGERLHARLTGAPFAAMPGGRSLGLSLGVAPYRKHEDSARFLARAEGALNIAKVAGRNRVVAVGEDGNAFTTQARAA